MKKALVIIPFETVYPTMNGGMLRVFNLLIQLTKRFETTVIINQEEQSFLKAVGEFPVLKKCRVISTKSVKPVRDLFSLLPQKYANVLRYRYWNRSIKGPADSDYLKIYRPLKKLIKETKFDYAILEDMSILSLAKLIRRYQRGVRIVYDAHNVNLRLAEVSLKKGEISRASYDLIRTAETSLFKKVNRIFACSDNDLLQLIKMNDGRLKGTVIPNGVNVPEDIRISADTKAENDDILFCGSLDYLPNREGLAWFCSNVFGLILKEIPEARLLVVGKGDPGKELSALLDHPAIINYGRVDSVGKYYKKAAMAIVPLLSGSGTRLKLLEAMAYRSPVVATSIGAEGINYTNEKNIIIADEPASFAKWVIELLNNPKSASRIADEAFMFVQNEYDWNIIGETLSAYLNDLKN